jgi:hypothetical protein
MLLKGNPPAASQRALDMNADGTVTISDAYLWLQWLFWLPGDYSIIALMKWAPAAALFMELSPASLASGTSTALSIAFWFILILAASSN